MSSDDSPACGSCGAQLLNDGGREAVSTRAVAAAAGVQPPTIYRQYGDMQGLLSAVAQLAELPRKPMSGNSVSEKTTLLGNTVDKGNLLS